MYIAVSATGPVVDNKNTQSGSDSVASSGTPLPRTQESDFGVEGKNAEITHGADLTKETGKAFTQEKVDGAASGEKHLDSSLNKQQVPAGARELKEVNNPWPLFLAQVTVHTLPRQKLCSRCVADGSTGLLVLQHSIHTLKNATASSQAN